ncbi:MAG TPA: ABC transporter ATP-binding protein [Dehalococcoidales bacterium]|nr:ABC transporter ATP-binding protein [Dehalococcoidales bacterium]
MIELENIVKTYQMGEIEVHALRSVSTRIEKGEMIAIMGPSGSGKSTLMNIIGCLDTPTSGSYILDESEVSQMSDSQLAEVRNKRIGFVFQTFNLIPRTTAVANVELPLLYGNGSNSKKRALEALTRVGLSERAQHKPSELSGGEQQRVAIARALVNNPSIIFADEPTGNLDSRTSQEIIGILEKLNREDGITIVLVTHEPEIAAHTQRIILLRDGQIVDDHPVSQVEAAASRKANR